MRGSSRALVGRDIRSAPMKRARKSLRNAARVIQETGAGAIKVEGARAAETIRICRAWDPGDGPYRPYPQMIQVMGGFKTQGRTREECPRSRPTRRQCRMPAPSPCARGMAEPLAARSPRRSHPDHRHRGPRHRATDRSSCSKTCSPQPEPAQIRQAYAAGNPTSPMP